MSWDGRAVIEDCHEEREVQPMVAQGGRPSFISPFNRWAGHIVKYVSSTWATIYGGAPS